MPTDPQTIQSYDDHAESWSSRMRAHKNIAHEYLEKPAMNALLGDVNGLSVLCVGCGSGEECDYISKRGAARVVGIDASRGLVEQAKAAYPEIEFHAMDMEALDFPDQSFDLIYSSLALHYLPDWKQALSQMRRVLKDGGRILLSTHHPLKWGAETLADGTKRSNLIGFTKDNSDDNAYKVYGDYFTTRLIRDNWFGKMDVNYYHKPLETIFQDIAASGLAVTGLHEPKSVPGAEKIKPDFYHIHQKIPLFLVLTLVKAAKM